MLAVALGGITPLQIYATTVAMIAYTILLANFSLLCSVYTTRSGVAISLVMTALFFFFFSPFILTNISSNFQSRGYLVANDFISQGIDSYCNFCREMSVINRIDTILSTGYSEPVMSVQVFSNFFIGVFCFVVAWIIFERCTENKSAVDTEHRLQNRNQKQRRARPGRLAIAWKDFQFLTGGTKAVLLKSILYLSVILSVVGGGLLLDQYSNSTLLFHTLGKN